jgi:hypothetical protein
MDEGEEEVQGGDLREGHARVLEGIVSTDVDESGNDRPKISGGNTGG